MLKVVGASWLQTRVSTYLLVAVALLGIGTFILGEFGRVENDGIYSATVFWNEKEGYRIEFWGQGNDLLALPRGAARAYYKTGIYETGWSMIEIETHPEYPDEVQAFAAGLLEGSLTWQLIYYHWYNTIETACNLKPDVCEKMRQFLQESKARSINMTRKYREMDPYWHMVHLFHTQLHGLEYGWNFSVQRSRQSISLEQEDFYHLAMTSDWINMEFANNQIDSNDYKGSSILLKMLSSDQAKTVVAFAKNTAGPYSKMLRLIKKYKFGYHILPDRNSKIVPGQSIIMTSFPGALSSQDGNYIISGDDGEMLVAGLPIFVNNPSIRNQFNLNHEEVLMPARVMAANRLSTNPKEWSRHLIRYNSGTSSRQWISYRPQTTSVWIVEQIPNLQYARDYSNLFKELGFLVCTGVPYNADIRTVTNTDSKDYLRLDQITILQNKITSFVEVKNLMLGKFEIDYTKEPSTLNATELSKNEALVHNLQQLVSYRGDLDLNNRQPIGIIDSVGIQMSSESGIEIFEARSGPSKAENRDPFSWINTFPNISHMGHPSIFNFDEINPVWTWN